MKNASSYKILNDSEIQNYTTLHFPEGKAWAKKFHESSWIYKFILCLAQPFKYILNLIYILVKNVDIRTATELLENWERESNIPEKFARLTSIEKRRGAVERIQSKIPVINIKAVGINENTTYENYVKKVCDIDIEILVGWDARQTASFPLKFPIKFGIPWAERQTCLYVKVIGEIYPYNETISKKLNKIFDFILPSYYLWTFIWRIIL